MWILESDGSGLEGKKLWLAPGKKFLFGRTRSETGEDNVVVVDKTISRRHLTAEVQPTGPNDCGNTRSRSKITLVDLNTKIGTFVDGEQIRGLTFVLQGEETRIQLGKCKEKFTIKWIPIVLTFSFTTKEHKADPFTNLYNQLGPLDIKVAVDYERGVTTHVVAKKRNTSKGLQALIDGKYIVHNDTWINALVAAATPGNDEPSLQSDFETSFPDPLQYLPPKGDEPTQREEIAYAPDRSRQDMFEGYTFVFYSKPQFDNLFAPISGGQGKALLREVIPDQTTSDDFVRYVKSVAGEKGLGSFEDGSEGRGVVVVRFNPVKGAGSDWYKEFSREVALNLDHRLIEQNEFLDAILGNDASVLRRPLQMEQSGVFAPPSTAATIVSEAPRSFQVTPSASTQIEKMGPPEPARLGRTRRTARPQFKGFDDDFSNIPIANLASESTQVNYVPIPIADSQVSQGLFVTQDPDMMAELEPSQAAGGRAQTNRKRKASPVFYEGDEEEEEDILEQIAPATAAVKRRKLAEQAERQRRGEVTPLPPPDPVIKVKLEPPKTEPEPKPRGKKKKEAEIDILEAARLQREAEAAKVKAERDDLEAQLEDMSIEEIRKRITIESIPVRHIARRQRAAQADESDQWDDRWNGRKNFKKFRRQGAGTSNSRIQKKVIVQLEEVKKKDYGIGDDYWDQGDTQRRQKVKGGQSQTESRSQSQNKHPSPAVQRRAAQLLAGISDDEDELGNGFGADDLSAEMATSSSSPTLERLRDKTSATQNLSPSVKRLAQTTLTKLSPVKRQKQLAITKKGRQESESDSDDGMKFRFKKRK